MSWFTELSPPLRKQNWRLCAVALCVLLSCPHEAPLPRSLLPGNKLGAGISLTG